MLVRTVGIQNWKHPTILSSVRFSHDLNKLNLLRLFIRDKLAYVQVVTNCRYSVAQMCTRKECSPGN